MLFDTFRFFRRCQLTKRQILIILMLSLGAVGFETLGLGLLLPIGQYLVGSQDVDGLVATSKFWSHAAHWSEMFNYEIGIGAVAVASVIAMVARQIFSYYRLVYQSLVNNEFAKNIRVNLFKAYLRADLSAVEREETGKFTNTISTEVDNITAAISLPVEILIATLLTLSYVSLMIVSAPYATLVLLLIGVATAIGLFYVFRKTSLVGKRIVAANYALLQHMVERIQCARVIRLSRMEESEIGQVSARALDQKNANVNAMRLIALTEAGMEPIAIIVGVPFLVILVSVYNMDLATVGFILIILARMMPISKQAARAWQSLIRVYASIDAVRNTLDRLEANREVNYGSLDLDLPIEILCFNNVRFRYSAQETDILRGINLTIRRGEFVALVGPSGSGKSTLVDLIPRLRTPTHGEIQINGQPVSGYQLHAIRKAVAYVSQTTVLWSGSIRDQIAYAVKNASQCDIEKAAKLAHAHEFIKRLPNGYDTILGERGTGLSGGQRPRVELARALLRRTPILVLDEPTSNVDAESEHQISLALRDIHRSTDTIILLIGHRLGSVSDADRVIVLNEGKIVEEGRYDSLVRQDGWFAGAVRRQLTHSSTFKTNKTH